MTPLISKKSKVNEKDNKINKKTLNIHLFNPYMDTIRNTIHKLLSGNHETQNIGKSFELNGFKVETIHTNLITGVMLNSNDMLLLSESGLLIYHFNENKEPISINYFYYMKLDNEKKLTKKLRNYHKKLFESTLPSPNHDSFKFAFFNQKNHKFLNTLSFLKIV